MQLWDSLHVSVKGPLSLLFINSGTRPISILEVSLLLGAPDQARSPDTPDQERCSGFALKGKFDGVVIEGKKLANSVVTLEAPAMGPELPAGPARADRILLKRVNENLKLGEMASCVEVKLATISDWPFRRYAQLSKVKLHIDPESAKVTERPTPIILHGRTRTILSAD